MSSPIVIVVDPISTGGSVAFEAHLRGYAVMAVWCNELTEDFKSHVPDCCKTQGFKFCDEIDEMHTIEDTAAAVLHC